MHRLIHFVGASLALMASGCNKETSQPGLSNPSTLAELLEAHDREVSQHGKDLKYIQPIGRYGREGVLASIKHSQKAVSSYNGIELVFGVAEEARQSRGYDLCRDKEVLANLSSMAKAADAPGYEKTIYRDLLNGYCKPS
jgi:uncharacterized lipoprotein YajG